MIYLRTKFYLPNSSESLAIANTPKATQNLRTSAITFNWLHMFSRPIFAHRPVHSGRAV
jgi:hypothetical protein